MEFRSSNSHLTYFRVHQQGAQLLNGVVHPRLPMRSICLETQG